MAQAEKSIEGPKDWRERLDIIVDTMRDMSRQTNPQSMVRAYATRMNDFLPNVRRISLSRRGFAPLQFCITRSSTWEEEINPWKEKHRLPVFEGGILAELLYGNQPRLFGDLQISRDDPAWEYLGDQRSVMAIPMFDKGESLNMVVLSRTEPHAFDHEQFPEAVWRSNLFGRATHNLVLAEQLQESYNAVDRELQVVADLQRSLLPTELPRIPGLELAAYYQTSRRAGGDYYDIFALPDGKWGILIADVSGHGTPAAVMMAVTHAIAHTYPGPSTLPGKMLDFVNHKLATLYTAESGTFVTAFYGVYDSQARELVYASAGHNPPRLKRCGAEHVQSLDGSRHLPMGISAQETYENCTAVLRPGDQLIFYTDGITEAHNADGEMFGVQRLDNVLGNCREEVSELIEAVLRDLKAFTAGEPAADDRTLVVGLVS